MQTVEDLGNCFTDKLKYETRDFDEIIVVFDTHRNELLKNHTREKRHDGQALVWYEVKDNKK